MPQKTRTCSSCPQKIYTDNKNGLCRRCLDKRNAAPVPVVPVAPAAQLTIDREKQRTAAQISQLKRQYDESIKTIERLEREARAMNVLGQGRETFTIEPKHGHRTSEGTVVAVASDWHIEENVGAEVGGLNVYNMAIAKARAEKFFQGIVRLTQLHQQDIEVRTMVLALLGDFITNDIHDAESAEVNELTPMYALVEAQNYLISGIEFILKETDLNLVIPCHSGNHARTTHKTRFTTENGHSLEYLLYVHLGAYFRVQANRVQFIIPEGMHSYVDIYGKTIRFHHGHAIKYQGGVGGIYIPTNKAIAQWNKGRRADYDVFGHFHQNIFAPNFICNGSLIGYNAFALSIKADYEQPKQSLFLMDKKRGRTAMWPVLVNEGEV